MKIKPCPFCGGEAEIVTGSIVELWLRSVECKDCGANTSYKWGNCPSEAEKKAIEAWNRREPINEIVEHLEAQCGKTVTMRRCNGKTLTCGFYLGILKAIEIVKGVSNETD